MVKRALALSPNVSHFAPLFFSGTLEKGITAAKSLGYNGVEISVGNPFINNNKYKNIKNNGNDKKDRYKLE